MPSRYRHIDLPGSVRLNAALMLLVSGDLSTVNSN
jgi:hypothetical protein